MRKTLCAFYLMIFVMFFGCGKERGDYREIEGYKGSGDFVEIGGDVLDDKIYGGLLAQLLGNLNGLLHEGKYINEPGNVEKYTPSLPEGARTDDDTDLEWTYIIEMQKSGEFFLQPSQITHLWQEHINRNIWCANAYARQLMNLGIDPPLTGRIALNPWSVFNISGQFVCETFALIAPAMPQTAAMLGLNYTHVTIDGEPAQATQLFTSIIATAFTDNDLDKILDSGLAAVDPESEIYRIVNEVRTWCRENPADWRLTRNKIKEKYQRYGGKPPRDNNGYELNTSATIAALLYGRTDLVETLRLAFNFGWDADNNAATAATIVGIIKGRKWMDAQGWVIQDVYRNTSRDNMPEDETITSFGDRLIDLAHKLILQNGGQEIFNNGKKVFRIRREKPGNIEKLASPLKRLEELRTQLVPVIESGLSGSEKEQARSAYLALCLGEVQRLRSESPEKWERAKKALQGYPEMLKTMFNAPQFTDEKITANARAEGLK